MSKKFERNVSFLQQSDHFAHLRYDFRSRPEADDREQATVNNAANLANAPRKIPT